MGLEDRDNTCPLFNKLGGGNVGEIPHSLTIVIIVLNCMLLMTTSISNLLVVFVILKRSTLHLSSTNVFLASQASSSIAVFLLAHPTLMALQIKELLGNGTGYCTAQTLNISVSVICILISFLSVLAMAINQYLAVRSPTWYATKVNSKNTTTVVISIWLFIIFSTALCVTIGTAQLCFFIASIAASVLLLLALAFNVKSFLKIRQYMMQVQQRLEDPTAIQGITTTPVDISRHQKTAALVFCILATCLATHAPLFGTFISAYVAGWSASLKAAFIITLTLAYSSSSWNAAICFRWNDEVRNAVLHI